MCDAVASVSSTNRSMLENIIYYLSFMIIAWQRRFIDSVIKVRWRTLGDQIYIPLKETFVIRKLF